MKVIITMMAMTYRAIATINALLNLLPLLQSGSVKQLLSYPEAVIVEERDTTIGVESNPPQASKPTLNLLPPPQRKAVVMSSTQFVLSDEEDDSSDDEADDVSTTISSVLAPVVRSLTRFVLSDDEDDSSDDEADDESKLFGEDVEIDSLCYSVSDSDSIAVSDSDSIDVFLDNESSDSDLDSVVEESSVVEIGGRDKLIGTIVILVDLAEVDRSGISVNDPHNNDASMDDVEDCPEAEKDDVSMEDWKPEAEKDDALMDDVAVSDSDSIDVFLDNESSDSDLDSVVNESSVVEIGGRDKLIGTIVIVDDPAEVDRSGIVVNDHCNDDASMENVEDWEPQAEEDDVLMEDWEPQAEEDDVLMEDMEANMDWESLPL